MLEKLPQLGMIQSVEKLPDVHFQNPATPHAHRLLPQGFERLVRRASRSKTIRAIHKVLLVDGFQNHDDRPLEDLILKSRDTDRAGLWARSFQYVHPPHGWRSVRAGLGPVEKVCQLRP